MSVPGRRGLAALGALAAGVLLPLSMAPFGFWPLGLISVGLWFHLLATRPVGGRGRGLLTGWLYGVGAYGVGASWIYVSIHEHGHAAPLLAGFLVAVFVAGMALFPMLNGWLFARLASPGRWVRSAAWFVVLLIGCEWLLTWFLTGFPWMAVGYGQLGSPLAAFAPVGGVALVSTMTAVAAVSITVVLTRWIEARRAGKPFSPVPAAAVLLLPWLLALAVGAVTWTEPGASKRAALVQGNVAQETKWEPDNRLPIIAHYRGLTEPHWGADLILWPEAAVTVFEHQAERLFAVLDARGRESGSALVLGLPAAEFLPDGSYQFLNTARGLGRAEGRYVKRRLVPFGEYVPLEGLLRGLIRFFDLPMSRAEAGAWEQPPLTIGDHRANMAICYEVVYPGLVRDQVDVLLTISNDTWFGASLGPSQHLAIARMRALENGRWLLRATNNGITAMVDPEGVVRARLPRFEPGVLTGEYRIMTGRTPFNRLGSWPLYGALLVLAVFLAGFSGSSKAP